MADTSVDDTSAKNDGVTYGESSYLYFPQDECQHFAAPVTVYDPEGDLILVVGTGQRKYQIDSTLLVPFSRVFAAMLGPHFSEGSRFGESGRMPMELALPEDDPDAVEVLCTVLYAGCDSIRDLSVLEIYDVAILADKYDLNMRLYFIAYFWLQEARTKQTDKWRLMMAAYWFGQPIHFNIYTKDLANGAQSLHKMLESAFQMNDHSLGMSFCCKSLFDTRVSRGPT